MLGTVKPREQSGRDSFGRYKAQTRAAAIAALSILEGKKIDRVYCDLHDDYVIRKNESGKYRYIFIQVKTKGKQNHNWSVNELFGLKTTIKDQTKQSNDKIKDSFIGKLLIHTITFPNNCDSIIFETNIHIDDNVEEIACDLNKNIFKNKYIKVIVDRFSDCFIPSSLPLSLEEIQTNLSKLTFKTDVQYLKDGRENFEPLVKDKIYEFSEVDLGHEETKELILKLLDLVDTKSSGIINEITDDSIESYAAISIEDLLPILSISKDAYNALLSGGDSKAIKSVSIIQRALVSSGAGTEEVEYCSRCKISWNLWLRKNRHVILELDLNTITSKIKKVLRDEKNYTNVISLSSLRTPIKELLKELESEELLYDLSDDLLLGGVFSELVKEKA